jgi:hypothetical protein
MNRLITARGGEGGIQRYKVIGTLWRHKRQHIKPVAEICAALVCRRRNLFDEVAYDRF